MESFERLGKLA